MVNDTIDADLFETRIDADVLETIFNYSNDAICIVNLEQDSIVECNPAAEELFGYSRQELLSLSASDLHPQNFDAFRTFSDSVLEEGTQQCCECQREPIVEA